MSLLPDFIHSNADYDQKRIATSSRLGHAHATQRPKYVFVSFDVGGDEQRKKLSKRTVRSNATAYSHRTAPRGVERSDVTLRVVRGSLRERPSRKFSTASSISSGSTSESSIRVPRRRVQSPLHVKTLPVASTANISRRRILPQPRGRSPSPNYSSNSDRSLSPGTFEYRLPDPLFLDASSKCPFDSYPVQYREWYGQLIAFWNNVVFARGTRVIKASEKELEAYTIWSRRQELEEPALFYTALFLASGIPVAEGHFPLKAALWLRYKTVEAMKDAIADPVRSTSTPVILAVGRIALHEHIYGNRELAHGMHRPAQLRMINLRGGLANMGLPATTIQLIVWVDMLLSAEAGTEPYFSDVPKQMAIRGYTSQEAVAVTNYCSPKRNAHPGYSGNETPSQP